MPVPPAFRFHHISLSVADLDAQEAWYRAALGLTRTDERLELTEAGVRTAVLSNSAGLRVEFVERAGSTPVPHHDPYAATASQTFTHLALQVPDLGAAFRRLTTEHAAPAVAEPGPGATSGMRYAYIHDPEGNLIELIETNAGDVESFLPEQLVSDADHLSLSRLVIEIAWRIDHGQADKVWELFVPDGVLDTSGTPLVGHDAIRNWGRTRVASSVQTRHICSGMRFTDRGNGRATGSTLLTVFMHDGDGRGPAVPAVVGEDTDEFVRTDAGWRFASRTFETLFA